MWNLRVFPDDAQGCQCPFCCTFIHRVVFKEVSGHRVLLKSVLGNRGILPQQVVYSVLAEDASLEEERKPAGFEVGAPGGKLLIHILKI